MFVEQLDYTITHLGWLGFVTAIYFLGIGLWCAGLLWRRSKAAAWQARCELFEEYRSLNEAAVENQIELLEAFEIQEQQELQQRANLDQSRQLLAAAHARCKELQITQSGDQETIAEQVRAMDALRTRLDSATEDIRRRELEREKTAAEHGASCNALHQRIAKLENLSDQSVKDAAEARQVLKTSDTALAALRQKYADLMKDYAAAKQGQESLSQIGQEHQSLQEHVHQLRDELAALQISLADRDEKCEALNRRLSTANSDAESRTAEIEQLRVLQASTMADLRAARKTIVDKAQLQSEFTRLKSNFAAIERELEETLLSEHNARMHVEAAAIELNEVRCEADTVRAADQRQIADLRVQLDEAETKLSEIIERPDDADDLTEIVGINRSLEDRLNEIGICRFEQIAGWDAKAKREFERRLRIPARIRDGAWVEQARELAGFALAEVASEDHPEPTKPTVASYIRALHQYGNLSVKVDESLGVVFTRPPVQIDDLTQIRGIGRVNERCLRKNGVYRIRQIADWNEYNVWAFNQLLSFKGRIEREQWIVQAQHLLKAATDRTPDVLQLPSSETTMRSKRSAA